MRKKMLVATLMSLGLMLTLILAMSLSSAEVVADEDIVEDTLYEHMVAQFGQEFLENRNRAVAIAQEIEDSFPQNELGETIYPDDFGGLYLDSDGNLVILVVGSSSSFENFAYLDANVIIREVEFSHAEIRAMSSSIAEFFWYNWGREDSHPVADNITSVGFTSSENRVFVWLRDASEEQINLFKSTVIDSPMVSIEASPSGYSNDLVDAPFAPPAIKPQPPPHPPIRN
ncbi:MAG: hypothetical protein FWC89_05110 [Defluviitaleaceae bacterium]|nr:hypothetical protein [Defluviitaleaceae bacterium]